MKKIEQIVNGLSLPALAIDINHEVIFWNKACENLTGIKEQEIIGTKEHWKGFYKYYRPILADLVLNSCKEDLKLFYNIDYKDDNNSYCSENWFFINGELRFLALEAKPILDDCGKIIGAFEVIFDLTQYRFLTDKLKISHNVFNSISDGVIITDENHKIIFFNKAMEKISGVTSEVAKGLHPQFLFVDKQDNMIENCLSAMVGKDFWSGEFWCKSKNGKKYLTNCTITKIMLDNGEINYIFLLNNITSQKKFVEKLNFLENYDYLTKLPNRSMLEKKIVQAIKNADKNNKKCAVLFLDLDKFKHINDSLGHETGDILLKEVGRRLKRAVKSVDTISRQGGDEFVVLIENIDKQEKITKVVKKIINSFEESFLIKEHRLSVTTSIGIAIYPEHGNSCADLLKNADTAMYWTKYSGHGCYTYYNNEMNAHIIENVAIIDKLNHAIPNNLTVHFQPQYCAKNKKIYGAEALVRWYEPNLGWINPAKFIPLAEEFGLIKTIGEFVLNSACKVIKETNLKVGVNVSPIQLMDENILSYVEHYIKKHEIDPSLLTLEITETSFIKNFKHTKDILDKLKTLGVKLALDDFGTGYSSLAYLNQLPFDYLKIDQSFIKEQNNMSIVLSIIDMAEKLKLTTIAEGIETLDQLIILKYSGCSIIQGFYYSKPLSIESYINFIKEHDPTRMEYAHDKAVNNLQCLGLHNVDDEHLDLIEELDILEEQINSVEMGQEIDIKLELNNLYSKLLTHFMLEEESMLSMGYDEYKVHNLEHTTFLEKYMLLYSKVITGFSNPLSLLTFVRRWLMGHILIADKRFLDVSKDGY